MAKTILDNIKIDEVWGNEISLEYQNKFAGTCDLTAVAYGKPSIIDWKQTNKPKKEEWVEDYKFTARSLLFSPYGQLRAHRAGCNSNVQPRPSISGV